jgi:hypothetical protein
VVLRGVERAERAVPLAVQEADAVAVEDVEHLRVGARARAGRRRRRRGDIRRDGGQRRAAEELHRRICGRRGEADLRTGRTGGEFFDANEAHRNAAFFWPTKPSRPFILKIDWSTSAVQLKHQIRIDHASCEEPAKRKSTK